MTRRTPQQALVNKLTQLTPYKRPFVSSISSFTVQPDKFKIGQKTTTLQWFLIGGPLPTTKFAMYAGEQDSHGLLTLHYGKHHATIVDEIKTCFASENYADMTFICDDKTTLSAHKLIMATASPLVRRILCESVHANGPCVVLLPGIKSCHLKHLLDFLYNGQACIKVI